MNGIITSVMDETGLEKIKIPGNPAASTKPSFN